MQSLKVGPDNVIALAAIAESLRRRAEQARPAFSTRAIIDACFPGTFVTGRRLPKGVHDIVRIDEAAFRSHRAPHVIVYRRGMSTAKQRHAIIHALGHIIFDGATVEGCGDHRDDRELRCDRFADEVLAPLDAIRAEIADWPAGVPERHHTFLDMVDRLASKYHVPSTCIRRVIRRARG